MGGASHPGEVIEFKVLIRVGTHVVIQVATPEEAEYLKTATVYVGSITPKSE